MKCFSTNGPSLWPWLLIHWNQKPKNSVLLKLVQGLSSYCAENSFKLWLKLVQELSGYGAEKNYRYLKTYRPTYYRSADSNHMLFFRKGDIKIRQYLFSICNQVFIFQLHISIHISTNRLRFNIRTHCRSSIVAVEILWSEWNLFRHAIN